MKPLIIVLSLLMSYALPTYAREIRIVNTVTVYRINLLTSDNKYVIDTVSARDENDARRIIRYRYPDCIIYSVTKVG